jgi:hypothetical protein
MPAKFRLYRNVTAAALAGLLVASCGPMQSSPQQVQATNPTVTYKYRSDQELVQTNQRASEFCSQYQSAPRAVQFATDPDGGRVVIFECVQMAAAPVPQSNPNLTYTYQTDQELLDASRNAQMYCSSNGSQEVISNVVTNANGTRTVIFQCAPR